MYENKFISLLEVIIIMVLVVVAVAGKRYFLKNFYTIAYLIVTLIITWGKIGCYLPKATHLESCVASTSDTFSLKSVVF